MNSKNQEFNEYFLSIINDYNWKIINSEYIIKAFDVNNYYVIDYNFRNNHFWMSHSLIWSKLEARFGYTIQNNYKLIINILEEHFNLTDISLY